MIISKRMMKYWIPVCLVMGAAVFSACWVTIGPSASATSGPAEHASAYIKFSGAVGEVNEVDHTDWSDVASFQQGIISPSSGATGPTRRRSDVVLEDIQVVKVLDKASPKLAEAALKGKVFDKVEIHLTGPSYGSLCQGTFLAYELKNVLVTSYSLGGSSIEPVYLPGTGMVDWSQADDVLPMPYTGLHTFYPLVDAPLETLSLNFEEIKVTYSECDEYGAYVGNVEYSWKVE